MAQTVTFITIKNNVKMYFTMFFIISISVQALFIISYFAGYCDNNSQSIPVGIITQCIYIFISAIVFIFVILKFDWIIFKHQCSSFDTIYKYVMQY